MVGGALSLPNHSYMHLPDVATSSLPPSFFCLGTISFMPPLSDASAARRLHCSAPPLLDTSTAQRLHCLTPPLSDEHTTGRRGALAPKPFLYAPARRRRLWMIFAALSAISVSLLSRFPSWPRLRCIPPSLVSAAFLPSLDICPTASFDAAGLAIPFFDVPVPALMLSHP